MPSAMTPYPAYHHTWLTSILPQMEQQARYDNVNFRFSVINQPVLPGIEPIIQAQLKD
jgi:hypothetical protein